MAHRSTGSGRAHSSLDRPAFVGNLQIDWTAHVTIDEFLQPILNTTQPLRLEDSPLTIATWDSLAQLNLITAIEDTIGGELTTNEVVSLKSVAAVLKVCNARGLELTNGSPLG
jgi:acyl carrier protein